MNDEITLYHNPQSRGLIALWMLEEVGATYRVEVLDFDKREHKAPSYLKLNPMGKIPTIVHRGTVITEAAAICAYLADAFPQAKMAPALDDPRRGTYYRWLFFGAGCIEPALLEKGTTRDAAEKRRVAWGGYDDVLNALETALQPGPYILGDQVSAADIYVGAEISWGLMVGSLEPRPIFVEYANRLRARPASQRVGAKNEALSKPAR